MKQVFFFLAAFILGGIVVAAALSAEDAVDPAAGESHRPLPLQWAGRQQPESCETLFEMLRDRFSVVRHFELRRHPCAISRQAQAFLKIMEDCRRECPLGFVEKNGITKRIVRHIRWLAEENSLKCPP